jgi:hypothetical protein
MSTLADKLRALSELSQVAIRYEDLLRDSSKRLEAAQYALTEAIGNLHDHEQKTMEAEADEWSLLEDTTITTLLSDELPLARDEEGKEDADARDQTRVALAAAVQAAQLALIKARAEFDSLSRAAKPSLDAIGQWGR